MTQLHLTEDLMSDVQLGSITVDRMNELRCYFALSVGHGTAKLLDKAFALLPRTAVEKSLIKFWDVDR